MSPLKSALWRTPGTAGVMIAVLSLPLVFLLRDGGVFVALVALCLYPILDLPRTLARPSFWRAALVSVVVWLLVFALLVSAVDSRHALREGAMIFLLPFTMYPLVLVICGLVRLEGRLRGRPRESGPRIAALLGAAACGFLVGVPLVLNAIPAVMEKITGNTPPQTVYSANGEVRAASHGQVTVDLGGGRPESFHLGPETRFDFRGPGSPRVDRAAKPAGPGWLEAGQRVGLEYVRRGGELWAHRVDIWIERAGCAANAKWTAAAGRTAEGPAPKPSLAGTTWEGWIGPRDPAQPANLTTYEFLEGNRLAYQETGGPRYTNAHWRRDEATVWIEVNDCYSLYEGRIEAGGIKGEFSNEAGMRTSWTARPRGSSTEAQGK